MSGEAGAGAGGAGGYGVSLAGLSGVNDQLAKTAADIAAAKTAYTGSACYASTAFGEFGVDQAWAAFDSAWSKEISVTQRALDELSQKMSTTTQNYHDTEKAIAAALVPAGGR
ncbi:type VII secretion target [Kitasatospora sp. NPDC127111]|uniref:type VII secretion target n=1 Tax=Kitasatospora sp. NPDC127111 TaxID=3345363 RepID=UPI00363AC909